MVQMIKSQKKDLGLKRQVEDALPYAVVGGTWEGSIPYAGVPVATLLNYIVPTGLQLKILFLRVWGQGAARFRIIQSNPIMLGLTGVVEAFPVVGSVPPYTGGLTAVRDYPFLNAAGEVVLGPSQLENPVLVGEGSIDFQILNTPTPATANRYAIVWWGVQAIPESP